MKKFTLFIAAAALAVSASAQYQLSSPYADVSVISGTPQIFDIVVGSADYLITPLEQAGQTVNNWGTDDVNRHLYIWEGTFIGGDGSYPGCGYDDMSGDSYPSLDVTTVGWSGAGWFITPGSGVSNMHWNDQTKFHASYRSSNIPGQGPASVALIINEVGDEVPGASPAKVAVGTSFVDGGATYPTIGAAPSDEWQAVEISFADLKKVYPTFNVVKTDSYGGNVLSVLAGGVQGQNISLDCVYFCTPIVEDAGVAGVENDAQFVITANTVNVSGGNGIELYDLSGALVKKTNGIVLGIDDLGAGVYVVKSGKAVAKIVK